MIGQGAAVLNGAQPGGLGGGAEGRVPDALLQPQRARQGAHAQELALVGGQVIGAAKDVDDVDRLVDLIEPAHHHGAKERLADEARVDGPDAVALLEEVGRDIAGRPAQVGVGTEDRDDAGLDEELAGEGLAHCLLRMPAGQSGLASMRM